MGTHMPERMLSVEEALERVLSLVRPLPQEEVPILEALERVLGEDIVSDMDIPPFQNSAMDGYAVRAEDVHGASPASPVRLRVIGDLAAGRAPDIEVAPGTAVRIMTGAPIPAGADAVVRFEDTDEGQALADNLHAGTRREEVLILRPAAPHENVRDAGEDIRRGERVLTAGTILRPQEIGVLASLGHPTVRVHRKPRVAVLATGDELVDITEPLGPGKIRNSNEYSNSALVLKYGGIPIRLGIARDNPEDVRAKIRAGLDQHVDLFITSAGVSVGDYDVVKDVLGQLGRIDFWQVRMKPGKPLAVGLIDGVPLIGLPGNPVSSMVSFEQFVRPAMRVMQGRRAWRRPHVQVIVDEDIKNTSGRRHFIRAIVTGQGDQYYARTTGDQGSGILTSMVKANALLIIPEDQRLVRKGELVTAEMLDWPELE
ncbi:MAG: molybdopterin molybdotransferase MoeA [Anaerolineae bacterium]